MSTTTKKKRIIFVTARFPVPAIKGDQLVAVQRIKSLVDQYDVELISLGSSSEKQKQIIFKLGVSSIKTFKRNKIGAIIMSVIQFLFFKNPLQLGIYSNKRAKKYINQSILENKVDLVFASLVRVWNNIDGLPKEKIVIDYVDCQVLNLNRRIKETENIFFKLILKRECYLLKKIQLETFDKINTGIFISKIDKDYLIKKRNLIDLPLGVHVTYEKQTKKTKEFDIIFTGNMKYFPNRAAISWFVTHVFSRAVLELPNLKMLIAGRFAHSISIPEELKSNVEIKSDVKDMATTIKTAKIAIAPMTAGSGMQFKILEAMAVQIPVITNRLGLGAIKATKNKDIIMAETKEEWLEAISSLLHNKDYRNLVGFNGRRLVTKKYDMNRVNELFKEKIAQIIDQ